jgi:hypothetical protein
MFLDSCFDISLRFPDVKTAAIRDFARNLVDASGGAAGESAAAVCTYPIDFKLAGAVARARTEVGVLDSYQKLSS